MKLYHLHEIAMKVTCTKCKKVMDAPEASSQVPTQGVKDVMAPNVCDQCLGKDQIATLPPALSDFTQGAVGPNATNKKLTQLKSPEPLNNIANQFRRPPPLGNNAQPV